MFNFDEKKWMDEIDAKMKKGILREYLMVFNKDTTDDMLIEMGTAFAEKFWAAAYDGIAVIDMRYSLSGATKEIPSNYRDDNPWIKIRADDTCITWWKENYGEMFNLLF